MKKKTNSPVVTEEYLDVKLSFFKEEIIGEVKDIIRESNSSLYTRIDPLLSELENNRLDRELTTEQLRNLDKRVTKLENPN